MLGAALEPQRAQHAQGLESIDQILSISDSPGRSSQQPPPPSRPPPCVSQLLEQLCMEGAGGRGGSGGCVPVSKGPVHLRVCGVGSAWAQQDTSLAAAQQLGSLEACRCGGVCVAV